jgi:hypothetical protein
MTQEEFKKLIEDSAFLDKDRQTMLLENAAWMTPDERAALAKNVGTTEKGIETVAKEALDNLQAVESAINTFKTEELPKLREKQEGKEHGKESEDADKLLEGF